MIKNRLVPVELNNVMHRTASEFFEPKTKTTLADYYRAVVGRPPKVEQHPDDAAVDAFAAAMKSRLARMRAGRRGDRQPLDQRELSCMLFEHASKGDPVDVAVFAMLLHQNGQCIETPEVDQAPVAYAVFTPEDFIQIWCAASSELMASVRRQYGDQLVPLYRQSEFDAARD